MFVGLPMTMILNNFDNFNVSVNEIDEFFTNTFILIISHPFIIFDPNFFIGYDSFVISSFVGVTVPPPPLLAAEAALMAANRARATIANDVNVPVAVTATANSVAPL